MEFSPRKYLPVPFASQGGWKPYSYGCATTYYNGDAFYAYLQAGCFRLCERQATK